MVAMVLLLVMTIRKSNIKVKNEFIIYGILFQF